jgi:hypothetical protein
MFAAMRTIGKNSSISKRPRQPNAGRPITLLFRWGVWVCYTEWRPDQPHEDWSGGLTVSGGTLRSPRQVMYHGCWGAQRRTFIELPESRWESPLIHFPRPLYGYKGLEGLAVNVEGDANTILHFRSAMLDTDIRLGDIPDGDWLTIPAGRNLLERTAHRSGVRPHRPAKDGDHARVLPRNLRAARGPSPHRRLDSPEWHGRNATDLGG